MVFEVDGKLYHEYLIIYPHPKIGPKKSIKKIPCTGPGCINCKYDEMFKDAP